ncbi:MAG TPA: bifunctional precorrin-2 dehydrogenase/sirohydrochlorin ferrochelatase [Thermoanaerobaculia bacterium]|nr:bifunctional precorrin-2 dehydrogenase/sirohydrochlorin ferrochelatase [Thermoanaerobaculia bacterium]
MTTGARRPYFPIFIDVEGKKILVVGGGEVAARKVRTLLPYGPNLTVVAEKAVDEIVVAAGEGLLDLVVRRYEESDLGGQLFVIAATSNGDTNARIAAACRDLKIPVNVVDAPELCDFTVPAIVQRGSVQLAISTGGSSPALAKAIRQRAEKTVGPEIAAASELLGSLRQEAKRILASDGERKRFFDAVLDSGFLDLAAAGRPAEAYAAAGRVCDEWRVPRSEVIDRFLIEDDQGDR